MKSPRSAARPAGRPAGRCRSRSTSKYAQFAQSPSVNATVSSAPDLTSRILRHERLVVAGGVALLGGPVLVVSSLSGARNGRHDGRCRRRSAALVADVVADDGGDDAAVGGCRRSCFMRGCGSRAAGDCGDRAQRGCSSPAISRCGCSSRWPRRSRSSCSQAPSMIARQPRLPRRALLIAAGLYQLSPLKRACLGECRSPAQFLSRHWRPGVGGALRLGTAARRLLRRLLLGADGAAVRRRSDEPVVDRRARGDRRASRSWSRTARGWDASSASACCCGEARGSPGF